MQKQTEPNVKPKPANGRRNLGKEKASAMHTIRAEQIDAQVEAAGTRKERFTHKTGHRRMKVLAYRAD